MGKTKSPIQSNSNRTMVSPNRITLAKFEKSAKEVLAASSIRQEPTVVVGSKGNVIMTIGLNGRVVFPDPNPDPLKMIEDD